jgi:hypothetical protein
MYLINPDVIAEARGLSIGASGFLLFVGFLLWAFGWRWHRFWVVFAITLTAGILGLSAGQSAGVQILVVGVLSAVAAGMLALELARILAFVTGGVAAWVAATAVVPGAQELWAVFLCGGLIGVVLYKLWTMIAMSLMGILVCWHTMLVMWEGLLGFDAPKWAAENASALNGAVVVGTILGVIVQSKTGRTEAAAAPEAHDSKDHGHEEHAAPAGSLFGKLRWS